MQRRNVPTYLSDNERRRVYAAAQAEGMRAAEWIRHVCLRRAEEIERARGATQVASTESLASPSLSPERVYEELVALDGRASPSALVRRAGFEARALTDALERLEGAGRVRLTCTRILSEVTVGLYVKGRGWIVQIEVERNHADE